MSKLRLLPDVPWGESLEPTADGLRFNQYAEILARVALDTPDPFTIGVYGGWGSGKTSLMRMICKNVEAEPNAIPVWFNAWRYEKEEHLIIPLLATIITEIQDRKSTFKGKLKKTATDIADSLRSIACGVSIKGKISIPGLFKAEASLSPKDIIKDCKEQVEESVDWILDQSLYFKSFDRLDAITHTQNGLRLVIFIDDLDRCFPDKAVALLEGIKLVLNQPNIAFVLGIEPKIIGAYLKAKYKKEYDISEQLYENYLDKLVQLPFPVPDIKQDIHDFARGLLKREEVFGKIEEEDFQKEYEPLVSICGPACKDNPRAIIRFLNRLLILKQIHEQKKVNGTIDKNLQISLVHFGVTNALQMKWPKVLSACEMNMEVYVSGSENTLSLCKQLVKLFCETVTDRILIPELESFAQDEKNSQASIFKNLINDQSLRNLLRSEPGIEWLQNPDIRREAVVASEQVKTGLEQTAEKDWPVVNNHTIKPGANLAGANLKGANLQGVYLQGVYLREADLREVTLKRANLRNADLQGANLRSAYLQEVYLKRANLRNADLEEANLQGAKLSGAKLQGANLKGANLQGVYLQGANYDSKTIFPKGFDPKKKGMIIME